MTAPTLRECEKVLREVADDLQAYLEERYEWRTKYPSVQRKYERDMEPVNTARALLARMEQEPAPPQEIVTEGMERVFTKAIQWLRGYEYTMRATAGGPTDDSQELRHFIQAEYLPALAVIPKLKERMGHE